MSLTVFANILIYDEERFQRLQESFFSFYKCDINYWVINVRGKYKEQTKLFLEKNLGKNIFYTSDSTVFHVGGGTLNYNYPKKTFLNYRNNLWMIHKNYKGKYKHTGLVNPNFSDLAKAMGGQGYTVENTEDFYQIFVEAENWANQYKLPVLLHIKTGSEMVLPGKRFSSL